MAGLDSCDRATLCTPCGILIEFTASDEISLAKNMIDYGRLRTDLLALAILAMAVFLGLSLVSYDPADPPANVVHPAHAQPTNLCGIAGAQLAHSLVIAVGAGAYFVLVALIVLDIRLFARDVYKDPIIRFCGACLIIVSACVTAQWYMPVPVSGSMTGSGGYVGAWAAILLDQHFSRDGSLILLATATLSGVLLTGEQHLARTAVCFSLLPITMWSRLAFGKRTERRHTVPIDSAWSRNRHRHCLISHPRRKNSNRLRTIRPSSRICPFPRFESTRRRYWYQVPAFRANPSHFVVSDGGLSAEMVAAIASFLAPTIQEPEVADSASSRNSKRWPSTLRSKSR